MSTSASLLPPKTPTWPSRDSTSTLLDCDPPRDADPGCDGNGNPLAFQYFINAIFADMLDTHAAVYLDNTLSAFTSRVRQ
ncbi:hypothetical protein PAXRUDRAFT_21368 [Paxillus rubicundulus Ve08.2h10]|uniref:Uncharacterized protein n=1 Tax=Paxillus rubicundulus Ve08.2h10 TaxID=930991 RepID=A0A0D0CZS7_9AGAM|nr:hypothetical protein PAXRUDRAFT_21368 [Paxillus rubicundulus Ve08.2h10]